MTIFGILGGVITCLVIFLIIYILVKVSTGVKSVNEKKNFALTVLIAIGKAIDEKIEEEKRIPLQTPIDKKREAFRKGGLKTFYYLDKGQIDDLYPQIFSNLELKKVETSTINESDIKGEIKAAGLASINAKKKLGQGFNAVYEKGEHSISTKYTLIENYFANYSELKFGLEDAPDVEKGIIEFKKKCTELTKIFQYEISEEQQNEHLTKMLNMTALKYIGEYSKATGYFALQVDVRVSETANDYCILTYNHPINRYLNSGEQGLKLNLKCSQKLFAEIGLNTIEQGKTFNITSLAKVSNWNEGTRSLELCPIAIY
jgi:hypothetical protein